MGSAAGCHHRALKSCRGPAACTAAGIGPKTSASIKATAGTVFMSARQDNGGRRLDDAARAGWLYYVAGNNQEAIAAKLGVSRQTAQRLVSLSVSEGLIKVRLDHPIGRCMDLAAQLRTRYALDLVEVVPSDPESPSTIVGIAQAAASEIERRLKSVDPDRHGDRHGPHAQGSDRPADADGVPAAQDRFAHRQHRAGRLGGLLQRHLQHCRRGEGAQLPHAAAGHRLVSHRSANCCTTSR